jgi:hypothetical protein
MRSRLRPLPLGGAARVRCRPSRALLGLAVLLPLLACGSSTAAPTAGTYEIEFPTVAAAIDSQVVTVYAFNPSVTCDDVLRDVVSGSFPTIAYQTTGLTCSLAAGGGGGSLSLPFGTYVILVVTTDPSGKTILDGCATQTISASSPHAVVSLQIASNTVSIPPVSPMCTLAAHCHGGAGC